MGNCAKHLCPTILTREKARLCPIEWVLDRFEHNAIQDVLFEDDLLELVFNDGIRLTAYTPAVCSETGEWSPLELDAEGSLEAFTAARISDALYVLDDPDQGIYYLQIGLFNAQTGLRYRVIIGFYSLLDEASQHITHFIGGSNGKK